eukprot:m51a1_g6038 putative glycogen phosphorylase 1 (951) ;mRNA; r:156647-160432
MMSALTQERLVAQTHPSSERLSLVFRVIPFVYSTTMSSNQTTHESEALPPMSPRSLARFQRRGAGATPTIEHSPLMHPSMNDIDEAVGDLTTLEEGDREEQEDYERLGAEAGVVATRYLWDLTALYLPKTSKAICRQIASHIEFSLARSKWNMDYYSLFMATALSLRDRMIEYWNDTQEHFSEMKCKRTYYLSIEYLMGRSLRNAVSNLDLFTNYTHALQKFGTRLEELYGQEQDAGLGNGGLGRLAACFLDSMATLNYPCWGYGIRYQYGMFKQVIVHGQQTEAPEYWLRAGNPWEICRRDITPEVRFGGHVVQTRGGDGITRYRWEGGHTVKALAYDTPVPGYRTMNTLNLRLWSALPATEFDLDNFNREDAHPDYWECINQRTKDENISKVLYPKSNTYKGLELRFKQQYFFCCATLQDIIRRFRRTQVDLHQLHEHAAIQLNDTHPTIAIAELMRILVDLEHFSWGEAWNVVTKTFGYTNHTILPEALETWPVPLVQSLLPRHLQIIYDINYFFCETLKQKGYTQEQISRMSIIEEGSPKRVRMANLAIVGSHHVNGVAAIHSEILKASTFADFYSLWPEKFINITNGVTPRRWLRQCNSALARVITKRLHSEDWVANLDLLAELRRDPTEELLQEVHEAKQQNKERLRKMILQITDGALEIDTSALLDVQIKRIHEYKRQLLNILGVIHRYLAIKRMSDEQRSRVVKKVVLFAGKAAPGYDMAKLIIKLINCVAEVVNADKTVGNLLKIVFVPNYNVSFAETIIPASDISQHISTAGTEASGTSNMKFAMNGGLIVGTLDGANVEIQEEVGKDNIFIFGATTPEIAEYRKTTSSPKPIDERLFDVLRTIQEGRFGYPDQYSPLVDPLMRGTDYYALAHDFASYLDCLAEVDRVWQDKHEWNLRCLRSISGTGKFSSDRTIREYAEKIWNIKPCKYVPEQSAAAAN